VKLEVGPLFQRGAAEAAKEDPEGIGELYGLLRLLPIHPRPDDSEEWHTDEAGELRRLRFGGYRVLYLIDEEQDRIALVQLGSDSAQAASASDRPDAPGRGRQTAG
jgi:mRNA-degrading endonuclease RelE of RelBE toxin-antitoxin system